MAEPHFGGPWTEDKLSRLRKYILAYMKIFSTNPRAKLLKTIYVDAFAGTGFRDTAEQISEEHSLFDVTADSDAEALRKGSTQVALETSPQFSEYLFIEHNEGYATNLLRLCQQFSDIAPRIKIIREDANNYLVKWCKETNGEKRGQLYSLILTVCRSIGLPSRKWLRQNQSTCGYYFHLAWE
jgi:three-Cys-motif partner protein